MAATFLITVIGAPAYLIVHGASMFQVLMFLFYYVATGLSITLGYHRLFAHRSFQAKPFVRFLTLIFGACAFEGSALRWVSDHRTHHKHTDHEDNDPYSIKRGFFWAHMGWILVDLKSDPLTSVKDLQQDKLVMWQHRYVELIGTLVGLVLPPVIGFLWGGPIEALGCFILAGVTRIVFVHHCTFFINSLCHTIGKQPFSNKSSARDSGLMALLTFGEGYHNFHHTFQHDYRNGVKPWSFDPTKWTIWILHRLGMASDLRRVEPERILFAEMQEARRKAEETRQALDTKKSVWDMCPVSQGAVKRFHELAAELSHACQQLEQSLGERVQVSQEVLKRWREDMIELSRYVSEMGRILALPA